MCILAQWIALVGLALDKSRTEYNVSSQFDITCFCNGKFWNANLERKERLFLAASLYLVFCELCEQKLFKGFFTWKRARYLV